MWHSAVKTAQNSAIYRRHFFQDHVPTWNAAAKVKFFLFFWRHDNRRRKMIFRGHDTHGRTRSDALWTEEVFPSKDNYSCVPNSVDPPTCDADARKFGKLVKIINKIILQINIYQAALVTSSPPFPVGEKRLWSVTSCFEQIAPKLPASCHRCRAAPLDYRNHPCWQ